MLYTTTSGAVSQSLSLEKNNFVLKETAHIVKCVFGGFEEFSRGKFGVEDAPRSGRPTDAINEKNVKKVEKMIRKDY